MGIDAALFPDLLENEEDDMKLGLGVFGSDLDMDAVISNRQAECGRNLTALVQTVQSSKWNIFVSLKIF